MFVRFGPSWIPRIPLLMLASSTMLVFTITQSRYITEYPQSVFVSESLVSVI